MGTWARRRYAGVVRYYLRGYWVEKVKGAYLWEARDYSQGFIRGEIVGTYPSLTLAKKAAEDRIAEKDTVARIKEMLLTEPDPGDAG